MLWLARAGFAEELLQILLRQFVVGVELQGALVVQPGLLAVADFGEGAAEIGFGVGVFGIDAHGGLKLRQRAAKITQGSERVTQVVARIEIIRTSIERRGEMRNGFLDAA